MKVICLSCFLGGYQQTVRKRVRRSQIIWHSYCSGLTHVLTFSDDVQRKEPECNTSDSDSFAWSLEMDYTRRNYMRNGTIWTCGKFDPSTIFSSAKKTAQPRSFLVRDKRSAFHPHGGTCIGKLLLPSTTWYASGPALLSSMAASLLARGRISNPLSKEHVAMFGDSYIFPGVGKLEAIFSPEQKSLHGFTKEKVIYSMLVQVWDGSKYGVLEPPLDGPAAMFQLSEVSLFQRRLKRDGNRIPTVSWWDPGLVRNEWSKQSENK